MCHLCHCPLLYFSLISNGPPPMSTLVPAWRWHRCYISTGSLRGTCPASAQTSNWHSETQISSLELSSSCHHVTRWWLKAWYLDTRGFIPKKIQWHIHTGSWSLVNCWREAFTMPYIRCSWILMRVAVGLTDSLGLDDDRCIRVIPRHGVTFSLHNILPPHMRKCKHLPHYCDPPQSCAVHTKWCTVKPKGIRKKAFLLFLSLMCTKMGVYQNVTPEDSVQTSPSTAQKTWSRILLFAKTLYF